MRARGASSAAAKCPSTQLFPFQSLNSTWNPTGPNPPVWYCLYEQTADALEQLTDAPLPYRLGDAGIKGKAGGERAGQGEQGTRRFRRHEAVAATEATKEE